MARRAALITLVALLAACVSAQDAACPLDPATTPLSVGPVATGCAGGGWVVCERTRPDSPTASDFCASCICSLVDAYAPAFAAAGVVANPAAPEAFPVERAAGIITGCTTAYASSLEAAGVNITAIAGLASCDFTNAATVPPCLVERVLALSAAVNSTVSPNATASDGTADAVPLRIATVAASPAGPVITLAGQLNSVSDLVKAMLASDDLLAQLTPAQAEALRALDLAAIDASPELVEFVGGLTNPINVASVLSQFSQAFPEIPSLAVNGTAANTTANATALAAAVGATSSAGRVGVSALAAAAALLAAAAL
ncbi:hypothetical protein Rsub_03619 [Raphidocelis subcapitata]|uniref:Uncharacterized protein n=1 Tax=Raphidocelis subcapitata TaxID=307507 RepID=A0A2V0NVD2_9CHLO|nr:hypothetical protein Rsub_03619 [Raphidocelis subcapitata]|eukprot:GBF91299.1 hypothetical protein Rsub_03619 [Raphidocelis subcapitata]